MKAKSYPSAMAQHNAAHGVTTSNSTSGTGMPRWEKRERGRLGALLAAYSRTAYFTLALHAQSVPYSCLALHPIREATLTDRSPIKSIPKTLLLCVGDTDMHHPAHTISSSFPSISCRGTEHGFTHFYITCPKPQKVLCHHCQLPFEAGQDSELSIQEEKA